jgi:copper transport protein
VLVTVPPDLVNGTYSVVWSILSTADGHPTRGYVPFTIGTSADVQLVAIPASVTGDTGAPGWLRAASRWLAYAGLLLSLAIWPLWSLVVMPALRSTRSSARPGLAVVTRLALIGFGLAAAGNLAALLVQAMELSGSYATALRTTLFDTRFGDLWLLRMLLLGVLAALLSYAAWVRPWRRPVISLLTIVASFALVVPFSLNAHASAQPSGRTVALAVDMVHLAAAGIWGGGVVIIAALVWRLRASLPGDQLRDLLAALLPRFSFLGISAWILLLLTGAYAAWLQVGNLDAARGTTYGNAFLLKLALAALLLALGATHFLAVSRRIARASTDHAWTRRFRVTIAIEAAGIIAILLVTGWLTSTPPARDALAEAPEGVTMALAMNDIPGTLLVTPGGAGPNHYRLTLNAANVPADAEAILRVTPPSEDFGTGEIALVSVGGNAWEAHGSEFSIAGDWTVEAVVRKAGEYQWQAAATVTIGQPVESTPLPAQPWRFSANALIGLGMIVIGAVAGAWAVTTTRTRSRKESAGIAIAGLVIGLLFVTQARIEEPASLAAVIADDATIQRGSAVYAAQCLTCHGVTGQGDGPQAAQNPVPPADFTDPIHQLHSNESMAAMVVNGFPESGMPPFGETLTGQQIDDVVAYVRSLGAGLLEIEVPESAACTVDARDPAALIAQIGDERIPFLDLGLEPIAWPQGTPANNVEIAAVTETVRQFVACTNAGDYGRQLALYTTRYLEPQFAVLDQSGRQNAIDRANGPARPLPPGNQLGLQSVAEVRRLDDGRLAARVVTIDPVNHPHTVDVILILAEEAGSWRIDEIRQPPPAPTAPSTPEAVTWPLTATVDGYSVELMLSDGPNEARPLRITLRDSAGDRVDGAQVSVVLAPVGAGIPAELSLDNTDPGIYFANAALPATGTVIAEITAILPDGSTLTAGFTFPVT